ncbi:MAG: hypothetical protein AVDCRST_MAG12-1253 [uncultured Rubrobacteraceae bacterium]|uniref:Uncharacterized protein n=1 Tax=uncultured Rubrobacteraceae bacterium TaxID=349277 RepID=A0A6J4RND4_9ACTN|nr:MAG: hypothetical protein AVDCRST_MAG12-1253 [uncultured Rubrobacteraceae bacterium]
MASVLVLVSDGSQHLDVVAEKTLMVPRSPRPSTTGVTAGLVSYFGGETYCSCTSHGVRGRLSVPFVPAVSCDPDRSAHAGLPSPLRECGIISDHLAADLAGVEGWVRGSQPEVAIFEFRF